LKTETHLMMENKMKLLLIVSMHQFPSLWSLDRLIISILMVWSRFRHEERLVFKCRYC